MASKQSMVKHITERKSVSYNIYFLTVAVVLVISFTAGTRAGALLGAIGPAFGLKIETGTVDLSSVEKAYQQLKANYDGPLDVQKLIDGASKGLVAATGDQYTVFMDAKEATAFDNDISGQIGGGIGAEVGTRSGKPTIIRVLPNNQAEKVGLKQGDVITAINDQSVDGWSADKAATAIRGEVGTTVKLTVSRAGAQIVFTISRQTVDNPSVQSKVENGIGILTITRFDNGTGNLAQKAAQDFKQQNVKAVILDLRDNGGGYLTAAQDVAGLWLSDQIVVSERTNGQVVDELHSGSNALLATVPTVVLVNGGSASASEIVAGALQDHRAAVLVGEKTYGKGTVQKVLDLGAGTKLKVTIARWYTPNGKNITKEGITPDQKVDLTAADADAGKDPQLDAAKAHLNQ